MPSHARGSLCCRVNNLTVASQKRITTTMLRGWHALVSRWWSWSRLRRLISFAYAMKSARPTSKIRWVPPPCCSISHAPRSLMCSGVTAMTARLSVVANCHWNVKAEVERPLQQSAIINKGERCLICIACMQCDEHAHGIAWLASQFQRTHGDCQGIVSTGQQPLSTPRGNLLLCRSRL